MCVRRRRTSGRRQCSDSVLTTQTGLIYMRTVSENERVFYAFLLRVKLQVLKYIISNNLIQFVVKPSNRIWHNVTD